MQPLPFQPFTPSVSTPILMLERNVGRPDHKACGHQNEYEGSLHLAEGRNAMRKPATGSSRGLLKISQQHILPLLHKDREDAQLWLPLEIKDTVSRKKIFSFLLLPTEILSPPLCLSFEWLESPSSHKHCSLLFVLL